MHLGFVNHTSCCIFKYVANMNNTGKDIPHYFSHQSSVSIWCLSIWVVAFFQHKTMLKLGLFTFCNSCFVLRRSVIKYSLFKSALRNGKYLKCLSFSCLNRGCCKVLFRIIVLVLRLGALADYLEMSFYSRKMWIWFNFCVFPVWFTTIKYCPLKIEKKKKKSQ